MAMQLQFNYAHIIPGTGECDSCLTFSYQINHPEWVAVPQSDNDYIGKFYDFNTELWYYDSDFTKIYEPVIQ